MEGKRERYRESRDLMDRLQEYIEKLEDRVDRLEMENVELRQEIGTLYHRLDTKKEERRGLLSRLFQGKDDSDKGSTDPVDILSVRDTVGDPVPEENPGDRLVRSFREEGVEKIKEAMLAYLKTDPDPEELTAILVEELPPNDPHRCAAALSFPEDRILGEVLALRPGLIPLLRHKTVDPSLRWRGIKQMALYPDRYPGGGTVKILLSLMTESREFTRFPTEEGELFCELYLAMFNVRDEGKLRPFYPVLTPKNRRFLQDYLQSYTTGEEEKMVRRLEERTWDLRGHQMNSALRLKIYDHFKELLESER